MGRVSGSGPFKGCGLNSDQVSAMDLVLKMEQGCHEELSKAEPITLINDV